MKDGFKFLLIGLLLISGFCCEAQKGINFVKTGNFNVALNLAKQQNKLLFMEVYAPDCHICNSFKGTFAQPQPLPSPKEHPQKSNQKTKYLAGAIAVALSSCLPCQLKAPMRRRLPKFIHTKKALPTIFLSGTNPQ